jgi:peptidoglycan hydrolase-like protein with peptidoglycan-binding domain
MAAYQRGAQGPEVVQIQTALKAAGFYLGPLDGMFGGGTESAVRQFQQSRNLAIDGVVGPQTWSTLITAPVAPGATATVPTPAIVNQPLDVRCLALTGSFETGSGPPDCFAGVSGNFDGQGISFGVMQWNLGQGSLQPILNQLISANPLVITQVFGPYEAELRAVLLDTRDEQIAWAQSVTRPNGSLAEPWNGLFKALGRRPECQAAQTAQASQAFTRALGLCRAFGVKTERAVALMFDIITQNGSISNAVTERIRRGVAELPQTLSSIDLEVATLQIIANRRAEASNPQWIEDVRRRKLAIANGSGTVHGNHYDLAAQYGIDLDQVAGL